MLIHEDIVYERYSDDIILLVETKIRLNEIIFLLNDKGFN